MARYLVDWGSVSIGSSKPPQKQDKKPGQPEKRRWKRFKVRFKTIVTLRGLSEVAEVADLSVGGIRLKGNTPLTYWDSVRLEFALPAQAGQVDIRLIGRVKRVLKDEDPGFGIEYETVSPDARRAIAEYLEFLDKGIAGGSGMQILQNHDRK